MDVQSVLQAKNLVISFYRGTWCPYCSLELRALVDHYADICAGGAELVVISPELPDKSMESIEREKIPSKSSVQRSAFGKSRSGKGFKPGIISS